MKFLGIGSKTPQKKGMSALERAKKRKAAMQQEPQMPPPPPGELFMEEAECAKTGHSYVIIWHRRSETERFTVQKVIKTVDVPVDETGDAVQDYEPADTKRSYHYTEFVRCGDECPWCGGHGGLIYCNCGKQLCQGGVYMRGEERRFSNAICGCDTALTGKRTHSEGRTEEPMLQMDGRKALESPAKRNKQARVGRDQRPGIGHDKTNRLPKL